MSNKDGVRLRTRKTCIIAVLIFIAFICVFVTKPDITYASPKPFKMLKIGSKNLTKIVNTDFFMYTGRFDGGIDIWMDDYKGEIKKGSRLKVKLIKGYKAEIYYVWGEKQTRRRIKNNYKIPSSRRDWHIELYIKKGKKTGYLWLINGSEERGEDW